MELWEGWREHSGTELVFREKLLEMLDNVVSRGWNFAGDSWWPVPNHYEATMPKLSHL